MTASLLADAGRGILSGLATCAIDGSEATDFRVLSEEARFEGTVAAGLKGVGTGDVEIVEEIEGSTVLDFFNDTGFGAIIGAGLPPLNCQRSNTDALRGVSLSFSGVAGVDMLPVGCEDASSWLLALTIFCTKPRPCSLLILGVGSLAGGGRRNAGEGLWFKGICGP